MYDIRSLWVGVRLWSLLYAIRKLGLTSKLRLLRALTFAPSSDRVSSRMHQRNRHPVPQDRHPDPAVRERFPAVSAASVPSLQRLPLRAVHHHQVPLPSAGRRRHSDLAQVHQVPGSPHCSTYT